MFKSRLLVASFVIFACWILTFGHAIGLADDAKPTTIEELGKLPVGLKVTHDPNPALATETSKSERRSKYTWWFKTTVASTGQDVKVVEFGAYVWNNDKWVFASFTGKPFSSKDFAEWYFCPDALVKEGKAYTDPTNWGSGPELTAGKARWYYIGINGKGERLKGEAVIEQKGAIDPKRPKDNK
ncbi:hypothetical protein AYO44_15835 [Planctomycetaceae bacterium SCGC AG-212-F19]|nr:hypothetical protein AYO44_15835 [Planctomycetaceae bacterium SCGC AG-212-F19]